MKIWFLRAMYVPGGACKLFACFTCPLLVKLVIDSILFRSELQFIDIMCMLFPPSFSPYPVSSHCVPLLIYDLFRA